MNLHLLQSLGMEPINSGFESATIDFVGWRAKNTAPLQKKVLYIYHNSSEFLVSIALVIVFFHRPISKLVYSYYLKNDFLFFYFAYKIIKTQHKSLLLPYFFNPYYIFQIRVIKDRASNGKTIIFTHWVICGTSEYFITSTNLVIFYERNLVFQK